MGQGFQGLWSEPALLLAAILPLVKHPRHGNERFFHQVLDDVGVAAKPHDDFPKTFHRPSAPAIRRAGISKPFADFPVARH